jgi:hypothetical protein
MKVLKRNMKAFLQLAMVAFMSCPSVVLCADTNEDMTPMLYEKLTSRVLKNFNQTFDSIGKIPNPDPRATDWETIMDLKTKLLLQLLDQIDRTRDLNFDFNDPNNGSAMNVFPPPIVPPEGFNAGEDPLAIKEPEIRLAYEEAIRENNKKAVRYNFELELQRLDAHTTLIALALISASYEKTPEDTKKLVGFLDVISNPQHKAQIIANLHEKMETLVGLHDFAEVANGQGKKQ